MLNHSLRIIAVVLALTAALSALSGCNQAVGYEGELEKAAIIDQLYLLDPDASFDDDATALLESSGFTVDLWQGSEITVDFYRKLPAMGYKLIIFRVHAGLLAGYEDQAIESTYYFTAENYTTIRYIPDQLTDKVSNAMISDSMPLVFAVNSVFVKDASGEFNNAVIISMGCESHARDDMATAFIEKGASAYVGWSTVVSLHYVDKATLDLLRNLCADDMPLAEGIGKTMSDLGPDPDFGACLKYSAASSSNLTVKQFISSVK